MKSGKADVLLLQIAAGCEQVFLTGILPPSLYFSLRQRSYSFPSPVAKLFHSVYTMGNWSLLWREAAFKNMQNLVIVGSKAVPQDYDTNLWEECLSTLWLEENYTYHPPISRGIIHSYLFKDVFIFL